MPKTKSKSKPQPTLEEVAEQIAGTAGDAAFDAVLDVDPNDRKKTRGPDKKPRTPKAQPPVAEDDAASPNDDVALNDADAGVVDEPAERVDTSRPVHSRAMVEMAAEFGLSDDDIQAYSPAELAGYVRGAQKHLVETLRNSNRPAPKPEPEPEETMDWGMKPDGSAYTEAEFGELAAPHKAQAKKLAAQQKRLDALEARLTKQDSDAQLTRIENVFATCDKRFKHLVGKGSGEELPKNSPALKFRRDAIKLAGDRSDPMFPARLRAVIERMAGYGMPATEAGDDEADPSDVYDAPDPVNRLNKRPTPKQWAEGGAARPTQMAARGMAKGVAAAERAVANKLRSFGTSSEDDQFSGADEDRLPD